jgi:hypothetical protein
MDGDIHNSNFMADKSGTQTQILVKTVHMGNFNKFEDASGHAASSAASCTKSVIMMDEVF